MRQHKYQTGSNPEVQLNAGTGEVQLRQFPMSGHATIQASGLRGRAFPQRAFRFGITSGQPVAGQELEMLRSRTMTHPRTKGITRPASRRAWSLVLQSHAAKKALETGIRTEVVEAQVRRQE